MERRLEQGGKGRDGVERGEPPEGEAGWGCSGPGNAFKSPPMPARRRGHWIFLGSTPAQQQSEPHSEGLCAHLGGFPLCSPKRLPESVGWFVGTARLSLDPRDCLFVHQMDSLWSFMSSCTDGRTRIPGFASTSGLTSSFLRRWSISSCILCPTADTALFI